MIQNMTGSAFDDALLGNAVGNILDGGGGDDVLRARGGSNVYISGAGNDTFVFEDGLLTDVINDFDAFSAAEKIDLSAVTAITDFADLQANHLNQSGANAVIADSFSTITLNNVQASALDASDFLF